MLFSTNHHLWSDNYANAIRRTTISLRFAPSRSLWQMRYGLHLATIGISGRPADLQQGGNAIDAAIATAICQTVVEPTNNGLGSDCFAIVWVKNKLYGINGSGYAPQNLTAEAVRAAGHTDKMPFRGWQAVTVPGAPSAWAELHKRFGRLNFAQLFASAIDYAENGYPVSPIVARFWQEGIEALAPYKDNPAVAPWFATFAPKGVAPRTGELVRLPDHAKTLRLLAESYCESYYRGELAEKLSTSAKRPAVI